MKSWPSLNSKGLASHEKRYLAKKEMGKDVLSGDG
jgi:hypothetical protein